MAIRHHYIQQWVYNVSAFKNNLKPGDVHFFIYRDAFYYNQLIAQSGLKEIYRSPKFHNKNHPERDFPSLTLTICVLPEDEKIPFNLKIETYEENAAGV